MTERSSIDIFNENYAVIKENIAKAARSAGKTAEDIILLAATKTVDTELINHAIKSGISYIGENKVQEFLAKEAFYAPVHKHFIGHLQTNKVKDIVDRVELIHSVSSLKLASEISKQAQKKGVTADVLLEVNIGEELSKSGFEKNEVYEAVCRISEMEAVRVKGLMAIPPICDTAEQNRKYFDQMNKLFIDIGLKNIDNSNMEILSMGMSDDYAVAIEMGANLVRIGTALFGKRNYNI